MKNLLYKELRLSLHPTMYLFLAMPAMLLIPSYPYYVAFMYTCLAVYFTFLFAREQNDIFYTAMLPIRKTDVVKAAFFRKHLRRKLRNKAASSDGGYNKSVAFKFLPCTLYGNYAYPKLLRRSADRGQSLSRSKLPVNYRPGKTPMAATPPELTQTLLFTGLRLSWSVFLTLYLCRNFTAPVISFSAR